NSNNVDHMHSIHSNGWQATSNYTLMLFQGGDNAPTYPDAKAVALIMSDQIYKTDRTTGQYTRGDFDFYGTGQPYLGVFRGLNMPGTLSEGSFHDYIPESWRLWNPDYKINEAHAIARTFIQFFQIPQPQVGMIAGIVRDSLEAPNYYYITGTADSYKPINKARVTLLPSNQEYICDTLNNGYFSFFNLEPGPYQLVFQADGYYAETLAVTAKANDIVFGDARMMFDTTLTPHVVSSDPDDPQDSIKIVSGIVINFDRSMSRNSVDSALVFEPAIQKKLVWSNSDKTVTITAIDTLEIGTQYTVTLSTQARSQWNVPMDAPYSFQFKTESKSRLSIVRSYPAIGQSEIPVRPQIRLFIDSPLRNAVGHLKKNIIVSGPDQQSIEIQTITKSEDDESCKICFTLKTELAPMSTYTIRIGQDIIKGKYGINLDTTEFSFKTGGTAQTGSVVDSLEAVGGWKGPSSSSLSVGVDKTLSTFALSTENKISGSNAGKMTYVFTDTAGGICRYYNAKKPSMGSDPTTRMGLWVFGDFSGNILEFWFAGQSSSDIIRIPVDTLNWAGWKLVTLPLSMIPGDSDRILQSVAVVQGPGETEDSSSIFIDDLQNQLSPVDIDEAVSALPSTKIRLYQNYPNPFNPSTLIRFQLSETAPVSLEIYNLMGEKIKILLDQHISPAGISQYVWDGTDQDNRPVSSGIYFYRLTVNRETVRIQKMSLLK
nr:Ig-like domain-containing protein [Candidatus Delongbacteria bacterium]